MNSHKSQTGFCRLYGPVVLLAVWLFPGLVQAQTVDYLVAGFMSERELLRRGSFRISGHVKEVKKNSECSGPIDDDFSGFSAFDYETGLLRIDRTWPECAGLNEHDYRLIRTICRCAYTSEMTLANCRPDFQPESQQINILPAGSGGGDTLVDLDVRMAGAVTFASIHRGLPISDNAPLQRFRKCFEMKIYPDISVSDGPGGLTLISMSKPGEMNLRRRLWINESRGFTIERSEFEYTEIENNEQRDFKFISEASWERINEVWVPISLTFDEKGRNDRSIQATLEWEIVNELLDPGMFTEAGLGATPRTQVIETRLGKPFPVAGPGTPITGDRVREQMGQIAESGNSRWWMLILGVFVLLVIGTVGVQRWRTA